MVEPGDVAAILLAAGRSVRFGDADKLLTSLDGEPLIVHAARKIVELGPGHRIAVCNDTQGPAAELLANLRFEIVENPHPERGLSHSLARGIAAAAIGSTEAALICLADMPFVSVSHLHALLARFDARHAPVIASASEGVAMPPALFGRALFDRLREARGDRGGKALLAGATLVSASAAELQDVDVPEDLRPE